MLVAKMAKTVTNIFVANTFRDPSPRSVINIDVAGQKGETSLKWPVMCKWMVLSETYVGVFSSQNSDFV